MPTLSGQYQLQDYLSELQARGFDGFNVADLTTYTNRGYYHVSRRSQWMWEQATATFTISPGSSLILLSAIDHFKSLDRLVVTTAGVTKRLRPLKEDDFLPYLGKDLTQATYRAEVSGYYIFNNALYVIPPPQIARDFLVYYHRRVTPLVSPTDVPITPQELDEAILLAATIRCHIRSNEPTLAAIAESALEEFFDDMRDEEDELMEEQLERVKPDNSWL